MHTGSVVGNLYMQGWISLGLLYVLRREMGLGCCWHDKWCGEQPLKLNFQIFLEWHAQERCYNAQVIIME